MSIGLLLDYIFKAIRKYVNKSYVNNNYKSDDPFEDYRYYVTRDGTLKYGDSYDQARDYFKDLTDINNGR